MQAKCRIGDRSRVMAAIAVVLGGLISWPSQAQQPQLQIQAVVREGIDLVPASVVGPGVTGAKCQWTSAPGGLIWHPSLGAADGPVRQAQFWRAVATKPYRSAVTVLLTDAAGKPAGGAGKEVTVQPAYIVTSLTAGWAREGGPTTFSLRRRDVVETPRAEFDNEHRSVHASIVVQCTPDSQRTPASLNDYLLGVAKGLVVGEGALHYWKEFPAISTKTLMGFTGPTLPAVNPASKYWANVHNKAQGMPEYKTGFLACLMKGGLRIDVKVLVGGGGYSRVRYDGKKNVMVYDDMKWMKANCDLAMSEAMKIIDGMRMMHCAGGEIPNLEGPADPGTPPVIAVSDSNPPDPSDPDAEADALWQEAKTLYGQNKLAEALVKCEASVKLKPVPERLKFIEDLKKLIDGKAPDLSGKWVAYVDNQWAADCEILQEGAALTYIIRNRSPEPESSGGFVADGIVARNWRNQRGELENNNQRIAWEDSEWVRPNTARRGIGPKTTPRPRQPPFDLSGRWSGYQNGAPLGSGCSIEQDGMNLTFIIHRAPEVRSSGGFENRGTVVAADWGPLKATIFDGGNRLDWGESEWVRNGAKPVGKGPGGTRTPGPEEDHSVIVEPVPPGDRLIVLTRTSLRGTAQGELVAAGMGHSINMWRIDTRALPAGTVLNMTVSMGSGQSGGSFALYPDDQDLTRPASLTPLTKAYNIKSGAAARMIHRIDRPQVFQFNAIGDGYSPKGAKNTFSLTVEAVLPAGEPPGGIGGQGQQTGGTGGDGQGGGGQVVSSDCILKGSMAGKGYQTSDGQSWTETSVTLQVGEGQGAEIVLTLPDGTQRKASGTGSATIVLPRIPNATFNVLMRNTSSAAKCETTEVLYTDGQGAVKQPNQDSGSDNDPVNPPPQPPSTGMIVRADKRSGKTGDLVMVPVYLERGQGVANMNVTIGYDAGVARAEGKIVKGNLIDANTQFEANPAEAGMARAGFARGSDLKYFDGTVAQIPFRITGQPGTRTPLRVAVPNVTGAAGAVPGYTAIDGEIVVLSEDQGGTGSTTGEDQLTPADALNALKMSVKLIPEDLRADMNKNGVVMSDDARLILQKVVGK